MGACEMPIDFRCEQCGKGFRVGDEYAGKKAKCGGCSTVIEIPYPAVPEAILLDDTFFDGELSEHYAEGIVVTCACGHRLTVSRELAGKRTNCPACMADLFVRDEEGVRTQDSNLLDNDTAASNPGAFRPQYFRYAMHFPFLPGFSVCLLMLVPALWLLDISGGILCGVLAMALAPVIYSWKLIREQCYFGCLNPGVVLKTGPLGFTCLAVFTDLTKGNGDYPVIKVLWQRVTLPDGGKLEVGMRLSTVAIYRGADNGSPHWMDFLPKAVVSLTADPAVIQMTMSQLSNVDWQELEMGMRSLEKPIGGGLHFLQTP